MLSRRKPSAAKVEAYLQKRQGGSLSYRSDAPLSGYTLDHTRTKLGSGESTLQVACEALRQWQQFDTGWTFIHPPTPTLEVGFDVAIVAKVFGLWWINACRLIEIHDHRDARGTFHFGFTYGTLPGHVARGDERFEIQFDEQQDVWFEILARSQPHSLLAQVGYPFMRHVQKSFAPAATAAMRQAVRSAEPTAAGTGA